MTDFLAISAQDGPGMQLNQYVKTPSRSGNFFKEQTIFMDYLLDNMVPESPIKPSFKETTLFWLKLGFISFGGPSGQIAIMHQELVEKRKWISEARFLHALNFCMLLPGPEAQQLATYIGWLLHRTWGGLIAGIFFVLPSAFILWGLSYVYVTYGTVPWIADIFYALKPAVLAIVASALLRVARKALTTPWAWGLAGLAFIALYFLKVPFPVIIGAAGLTGYLMEKRGLTSTPTVNAHTPSKDSAFLADHSESPAHTQPHWKRSLWVISLGALLWWLPIVAVIYWLGTSHAISQQGIFFSKAAMVTFGGAYAVLPYVSQQAVERFDWLSRSQMLDGLGLAETTPGPLIMVLQFVGFVGAFQHAGGLSPLAAGTLGAFITTWSTFVPCFIWIFLGGPYIEHLRNRKTLTAALAAVTAAVVGVILNLAVWFGLEVVLPGGRIDWVTLLIAVVSLVLLERFKWSVVWLVLAAGITGVLWGWAGF